MIRNLIKRKSPRKEKTNESKFRIEMKLKEIEREGRGSLLIKNNLDCKWKLRERDLLPVEWLMKKRG